MPDTTRYRLRAGLTLPHAEWIQPDGVYVGRIAIESVPWPLAAVQLFHPEDPSISEIVPSRLLEALP